MNNDDLIRIAERIMNMEQRHEVNELLLEGRNDLAKDYLADRVDTLYSRGDMEFAQAMEFYSLLQLPPERAGKFPQKHVTAGC